MTTERSLYPKLARFVAKNESLFPRSAVFELKIAKGERWYLSQLAPHQLRALTMAAGSGGVYHKISDQSLGAKPFDAFLVKKCDAYVVICFYKKGKYPTYFIPVANIIPISRPSLTEEECAEIASFCGFLP